MEAGRAQAGRATIVHGDGQVAVAGGVIGLLVVKWTSMGRCVYRMRVFGCVRYGRARRASAEYRPVLYCCAHVGRARAAGHIARLVDAVYTCASVAGHRNS